MLQKINLIENIGKFKATSLKEAIPNSFITLIYAENGCGKSTIASLLRSLAENNPSIIATRERLGGDGAPRASLRIGEENYNFVDGTWNRPLQNIKIFDDVFTDENLFSGLAHDYQHRENLHRFIVFGKRRVMLHKKLTEQQKKIRKGKMKRYIAERVVGEIAARHRIKRRVFQEMGKDEQVQDKIDELRHKIQIAEARKEIIHKRKFIAAALPPLNIRKIEAFLEEDLRNVQKNSLKLVQRHIDNLGDNGEPWLREGLDHICQSSSTLKAAPCPFCQQSTLGVKMVSLYQEYFSEEYARLQKKARDFIDDLEANHGEEKRLLFQNRCFAIVQAHDYWRRWITEIPELPLDIQAMTKAWKEALEVTLALLQKKLFSPLTAIRLDSPAREAINRYLEFHSAMKDLSRQIVQNNKSIDSLRLLARKGKLPEVQRELDRLEAQKNRHEGEGKKACAEYDKAVQSMSKLEAEREKIVERFAHRIQGTYSDIEISVNKLLESFGTAFQISKIQLTDGPFIAADYQLEIGNSRVGLDSRKGEPSFKTVLSTGDRSALSLSFFLSHIYSQPRKSLKEQIVVFDDPMASLDEHRSYETVRQLCNLSGKVKQVIVLSHSRTFLFDLYNEARYRLKDEGDNGRQKHSPAYILSRGEGMASEIAPWDIKTQCMTDNYKRRKIVSEYINKQDSAKYYEVGASIRLILEDRMASTFAEHQKPGERDSEFVARMMREGKLHEKTVDDLRETRTYLNEFHHNIDTGSRRAQNDSELLRFCILALNFNPRMKDGDNSECV